MINGKEEVGSRQPAADMEEGSGVYGDYIRYCSLYLAYEVNLGVVIGNRKPETDQSSKGPS